MCSDAVINRRRRGRGTLPLALGGSLLLPTAQVQAHTTSPGLGELGSGFLHPLTTPVHLLLLLSLGLWLGQCPPLRLKAPAGLFAVAVAIGLLLTVTMHITGTFTFVLVALVFGVGVAVAVDMPSPRLAKVLVCGAAALALGLDSGVDLGTTNMSTAKILAATWVSLVLCLVNATFYVSLLPAVRPAQIGVRVVGSWIVAIAMLMLAFVLRR